MRCISHDDTQARTRVFPQCCYMVLVHGHSPYTQGSRHKANVREPIRGCDSNFRDVLAGSDVRLPQRIEEFRRKMHLTKFFEHVNHNIMPFE